MGWEFKSLFKVMDNSMKWLEPSLATNFQSIALVASPVFATVELVSQFLPVSLVDIETEWLALLLSPINSIAAAVAVGGLLITKFFRRIYR